jgi:nitrite reductase/ring-hydroxylating ferredoxin subunit
LNDWRELPFAPASGTRLCELQEIADRAGREIIFGSGPEPFRVVVLRLGEQVYAYRNCCPHFSLPLNYEPDVFHVFGVDSLMCAHHTALFHIASGECYDGPCLGAKLTAIPIVVADGVICVA